LDYGGDELRYQGHYNNNCTGLPLCEQLYVSVLQSTRPNSAGSIQGTSPSQIRLARSNDQNVHVWESPETRYVPRSHHFFFEASSLRSHEMTFPSITTPLPSMKATRERPSQFLNVSHTSGCWGWKLHSAISLDFNE